MRTDLGIMDEPPADPQREMLERLQHQVRTPLTTLLGHLELLEDAGVELPYRLAISLDAVSRSGHRLRALLAELDESANVPSLG